MDQVQTHRPRVSRETRMLLSTALIAIVALWVLARVRFPDRPTPSNPVQPLLTQLTPRPTFADLAAEVAEVRSHLDLVMVPMTPRSSGLRFRDDLAITWIDPKQTPAVPMDALAGFDPASGLALVRVDSAPVVQPTLWPAQSAGPRYFIASESSASGVSLRPVYVASLVAVDNPRWPGPVWQLPSNTDLVAGSFLFTADAAVAGLVVDHGQGRALVPADTVLAGAERLLNLPPATRGYVGIEVQPLTSALAKAAGATAGLAVTWIDQRGPAADSLSVGEVIESANGAAMATIDHWDALIGRLAAADPLTLTVRGAAGPREVPLVATAAPAIDPASLGLTMRGLPEIGTEVIRIDPGSAGDRGGLVVGDVITRVDSIDAPTPVQVRRAFASADGRALIVGFTRGTTRRVTAIDR